MNSINNIDIINIIRATLNYIDKRLVAHGERVAYIMMQMLRCEGVQTQQQIAKCCLLGLVHDIGAFKTDEIDKLVVFETDSHFEHSAYGYLFLKYLSPLEEVADAILHHHTNFSELDRLECKNKQTAALIHLTDRFDILLSQCTDTNCDSEQAKLIETLSKHADTRFSSELIGLLSAANKQYDIVKNLRNGSFMDELSWLFEHISIEDAHIEAYLKMLVCSIDFRSPVTVLHTFTTTIIAETIGKLLGMGEDEIEKIHFGALLHDLGKIKTPLEILEKQGKLLPNEIVIMKQHVTDTRLILGDYVSLEISNIATRHHEKLNGSGYPDGLVEADLTLSEKIVAAADIMSALMTKRSYKEAFSLEETIKTVDKMGRHGYLDTEIVNIIVANADEIAAIANESSKKYIAVYQQISDEYSTLNN